MNISQLEHCQIELKGWHRTLEFYENVIRILEDRLCSIVNRNTKKDILVEVEHFQNQFSLQKEQLDLLQQDIGEQEATIEKCLQPPNLPTNLALGKAQHLLQEKILRADTLFRETKTRFFRFLANVI